MVTLEQKIDIILEYIADDDFASDDIRDRAREALTASSGETHVSVNPAADVDDMIIDLFKELGIASNLKGCKYAFTAVKRVLEDPESLRSIVKGLYTDIASKYGTSASCVERSIRTVVDAMLDRGDPEIISNLLGNIVSWKDGNIRNSTFIASCAQEVSRRMKRMRMGYVK